MHGHNWRVTLILRGDTLDRDGLLCDFHAVEGALDGVLAPLINADLNAAIPEINPTAELVARHIGEAVAGRLRGVLPDGARVSACRVTEAPGCAATYYPSTTTTSPA